MMHNANVLDQAAQITRRQNEIEMVAAVLRFDQLELAIQIAGFPLHAFKLVVA